MKLKKFAVLIIAAIITVMLYVLGATVYSDTVGTELSTKITNGTTPSITLTTNTTYYLEKDLIIKDLLNKTVLNITAGQNVTATIDLNGKTLDLGSGSITIGGSFGGGTLTIKGPGKIISTNNNRGIYLSHANSKLTIEGSGITISGTDEVVLPRCIDNSNGGTVEILGNVEGNGTPDDVTIIARDYGIYTNTFSLGNNIVKNATIRANCGIRHFGTMMEVTNSKIIGTVYGIYLRHSAGTNPATLANINGSTVIATEGIGIYCPTIESADRTVSSFTNLNIAGYETDGGNEIDSKIYGSTAIKSALGEKEGGGANITISHATIGGVTPDEGKTVTVGDYGIYHERGSNNGIFIQSGVTISNVNTGIYSKSAASSGKSADIKITGGTIYANDYGIYSGDGNVTIPATEGSFVTIQNADTGIYSAGGDVEITDGSIIAKKYGVDIDNGTLTLRNGSYEKDSVTVTTTPDITGGTYGVRLNNTAARLHLSGSVNINSGDGDIYLATNGGIVCAKIIIDDKLTNEKRYTLSTGSFSTILITATPGSNEDKKRLNDPDKFTYKNPPGAAIHHTVEWATEEEWSSQDDQYQLTLGEGIPIEFDFNYENYVEYFKNGDEDAEIPEQVNAIPGEPITLKPNSYFTKNNVPEQYNYTTGDELIVGVEPGMSPFSGFYWPGYEFVGWYPGDDSPTSEKDENLWLRVQASDDDDTATKATQAITYYAHWKVCEHNNEEDEGEYWTAWKDDKDGKDTLYGQDGNHSHFCKKCTTSEAFAHVYPKDEAGNELWDEDATKEHESPLKSATCLDTGRAIYVCEKCNHEKEADTPALGHEFEDEWEYEEGNNDSHVKYCIRYNSKGNGETTDEYTCTGGTDKNGVSYRLTESHVTEGKWQYSDEDTHYQDCSVCKGAVFKKHEWDREATVLTPATCIGTGEKAYLCVDCQGYSSTETIPANGHNFDYENLQYRKIEIGDDKYDDNEHWILCEFYGQDGCEDNDNAKKRAAHTYPLDGDGNPDNNDPNVTYIPPNCTEYGTLEYTCSNCDHHVENDKFEEPLGHNKIVPYDYGDKEYHQLRCERYGQPGCEENAYDIEKHGWEQDPNRVSTTSTCTEHGVEYSYCPTCKATKSEELPLRPHDYNDYEYDRRADVTFDGVHWQICNYGCGVPGMNVDGVPVEYKTEIHSFELVRDDSEKLDCVNPEGEKVYVCTLCHAELIEPIEWDGENPPHQFDKWVHNTDNHWLECSKCGEKDEASYDVHHFEPGDPPQLNCKNKVGEIVYTCKECGAVTKETVEWNGDPPHQFDEWVCDSDDPESGHWAKCSICGEIDEGSFSEHHFEPGDPPQLNCKNKVGEIVYTCKECGAVTKETVEWDGDPPHQFDEWVCDSDDPESGHWAKCSICGEIDEDSFSEHHFESGDPPQLNCKHKVGEIVYTCKECGAVTKETVEWNGDPPHQFDKWVYDANVHWAKCSICGEIDEDSYGEHNFEPGDLPQLDCKNKVGEIIYTCTECSAVRKEKVEWDGNPPHQFDKWAYDTSDKELTKDHWLECSNCGEIDEDSYDKHDWYYDDTITECKCGAKKPTHEDTTPEESSSPEDSSSPDQSSSPEDSSSPEQSSSSENSSSPGGSSSPEDSSSPGGSSSPEDSSSPGGSSSPEDSSSSGGSSSPEDSSSSGGSSSPEDSSSPGDNSSSSDETTSSTGGNPGEGGDKEPDNTTVTVNPPDKNPDDDDGGGGGDPNNPDSSDSSSNRPSVSSDITTDGSGSNSNTSTASAIESETTTTIFTIESTTTPLSTLDSTTTPIFSGEGTTTTSIFTTERTTAPPDSTDSTSSTDSTGSTDSSTDSTESTGGSDGITTAPGGVTNPGTDLGKGKVTVGVESNEGAPDVGFDYDSAKAFEQEIIESHLSTEERAGIENGDNMDVILTLTLLNIETGVSAEDSELTENFLSNSDYEVGEYYDASIIKWVNGVQVGKITQLENPITIIFDIPVALRKPNRVFAIIRLHDDTVDLLNDLDTNPNTITVQSDKFSTYVIVYRDNDDSANGGSDTNNGVNDNPYTGTPFTVLSILAFVFPAAAMILVKRNRAK